MRLIGGAVQTRLSLLSGPEDPVDTLDGRVCRHSAPTSWLGCCHREQVRLDTSLVSRSLLVDLIHAEINRIYYILLAVLTDAQVETTSDYWMQFGMTGVSVVYPTTQVINGITVPLNDFAIQPATNVATHWDDLVDEIEVCPASSGKITIS